MPIEAKKQTILLNIPLFSEVDKQRFIHFVMKCLTLFNESLFSGAAKLPQLLALMPNNTQSGNATSNDAKENYFNLQLSMLGDSLYISVCNRNPVYQSDSITRQFFLRLSTPPTSELIEQVKNTLYLESEVSDPELLRRHNDSIREEMKRAKKRAAQELSELEEKLEQKRNQLHESIRQAEIDSLTNILNRGAYDRRLQESVSTCQEQQLPLSLVFLDLDYFKQVNDTYGHQAGDEILKKMARSMTQNSRQKIDYVCRIGGDEFAIICFSNTTTASRSAYKVLANMKGKVSIGISLLRADDNVESLVARTDEALYEAKEKGRGQVVVNG